MLFFFKILGFLKKYRQTDYENFRQILTPRPASQLWRKILTLMFGLQQFLAQVQHYSHYHHVVNYGADARGVGDDK